MRRLVLCLLTIAVACARPALYYPDPSPAPPPPTEAASRPPRQPGSTSGAAASPLVVMASMNDARSDLEYLRVRRIIVPVAGALTSKIEDSFDEPRDGGRMHRAVDILAPRGTPVLAADDGRILRMSTSPLGGISIYAADAESRIVYYYAHLDRYHDAMSVGRALVKGDTIGFVGTTGNAPKDTPHLHFQVMRMPADGKYWNGEPINPYSLLVRQ